MKPFLPFALTLRDFGPKLGEAWSETEPTTTVDDVINAMADGSLDVVHRVIIVHPDRAPEDVSEQVADELIEREDLREDALDFCHAFGSPATKRHACHCLEALRRA